MKTLFVNICTQDLEKTKVFFEAIGMEFDANFASPTTICLKVEANIFVMMHTEEGFLRMVDRKVADSQKMAESCLALSMGSAEEVEEIVSKAVQAGGKAYRTLQDHGFMVGHGFEDLDGHIWAVYYMKSQDG